MEKLPRLPHRHSTSAHYLSPSNSIMLIKLSLLLALPSSLFCEDLSSLSPSLAVLAPRHSFTPPSHRPCQRPAPRPRPRYRRLGCSSRHAATHGSGTVARMVLQSPRYSLSIRPPNLPCFQHSITDGSPPSTPLAAALLAQAALTFNSLLRRLPVACRSAFHQRYCVCVRASTTFSRPNLCLALAHVPSSARRLCRLHTTPTC